MNDEGMRFASVTCLYFRFDDAEVQRDKKLYPYKIVEKEGKPYIETDIKGQIKVWSPEEISAIILGKMREIAEAYLGRKVTNAVVTCPGKELFPIKLYFVEC